MTMSKVIYSLDDSVFCKHIMPASNYIQQRVYLKKRYLIDA
jgi:hypothetical protein